MSEVPITSSLIRGSAELESTGRGLILRGLPGQFRTGQVNHHAIMVDAQPQGVRLVFRTDARDIDLIVHPRRVAPPGVVARGTIDLLVNGELAARDTLSGGDTIDRGRGPLPSRVRLGAHHVSRFRGLSPKEKRVEIWLPHTESIELVALRTDGSIRADDTHRPVWLHHDASMGRVSAATGPSQIWPAVAARLTQVDLHLLGFSNSAMTDPLTARAVRDSSADLISLTADFASTESRSMLAEAMHDSLHTIRQAHATTPILLTSPISPRLPSYDLARQVVEDLRRFVHGSSDPNLLFLDARELFDGDGTGHRLSSLDPQSTPQFQRFIAERFARLAFDTRASLVAA